MASLPTFLSAISNGLRAFLPGPVRVNQRERLRACCGALFGILLTGLASRLGGGAGIAFPLLIAPIGASAVLLFAAPASPLAQPWALLGGNLISALIGVACAQFIADPIGAAALAVAGAIAAMFALRCVHPPGGAVALTAVIGGPAIHALGFHYVLMPVGLNSLLLLLSALLYNNLTRRRYPHAAQADHRNTHATKDALPSDRLGFTPDDLDAVLKRYNQVLDISRDELESLFLQTEMHAYRRRFGEIRCADFMSRDVISVTAETTLHDAWALLRRHRIKALPVLDRQGRLEGIVTTSDILLGHNRDSLDGARHALRAVAGDTAQHTVGDAMTRSVSTGMAEQSIAELLPLLSDGGFHHVPIVDGGRRLIGMLTQSDLLAALYRSKIEEPTPRLRPAASA